MDKDVICKETHEVGTLSSSQCHRLYFLAEQLPGCGSPSCHSNTETNLVGKDHIRATAHPSNSFPHPSYLSTTQLPEHQPLASTEIQEPGDSQ